MIAPFPTFTGRVVDVANPRADTIAIEDIAHHLSLEPRFGGATRVHYSVAQHSYLVSLLVPEEDALAALLHDAPEAYCKDLPYWVKRLVQRCYGPIETRMWSAVCRRFRLPLALPTSVETADRRIAASELRDLLTPSDWTRARLLEMPDPFPGEVVPIRSEIAEQLFLDRFRTLTAPEGTWH